MKYLFSFIILVINFSFAISQNPNVQFLTKKIALQEQKANEWKFNKKLLFSSGSNYDLKYERLEWEINPEVLYIKGQIVFYFKTTQNNVSQITFDCTDSLTIDSVIYHGSSLLFSHLNNVITINLPSVLSINILDSIKIAYQGAPPQSGFGSFIKSDHNGSPIIWTLSEPYGASDWMPCKNNLTDKIDSIDIFVLTPQIYKVASNGLLISETTQGLNKRFHWKHKYPIATYLIAVAVTNYSVYNDIAHISSDSIIISNYVYPEDLATAQSLTPTLLPVVNLYDSLFMAYPYKNEKYGHAQFGWGGGMEHQTMTFIGGFGFEILAHEYSHQWFGNMVTCSSWKDIWINESFATYSTGLAYENLFSGYYWPLWKQLAIDNITSLPGGSVFCTDTTSVPRIFDSRLSYYKGAIVLNMMRWVVGDSSFFAGLKNYLNDPLLRYSFASTQDFKNHIENASGKNLTEFLNDWFYGEGYPIYNITCIKKPNQDIEVTFNQTQSHVSVSFFEMPVPIKFKNATNDTIIVFDNFSNGQVFTTHLNFIPDSAFFDPDLRILSKNSTIQLGIDIPNDDLLFEVFPNPAKGILNLNYKNILLEKIEIFDVNGRICYSQNISSSNSLNKIEISLNNFQNGNYFLKCYSEEEVFLKKFIIL
jgi:aminopeptidase N